MALFDHYFPVLGSNFGLGILGIFQCLSVRPPPPLLSNDIETYYFFSPFPGSQLKSYLTSSKISPSSPLFSFSPLGVSTFSSASSSVNRPKLNVPSALHVGAPGSGMFSQISSGPPRSPSATTLFPESFHPPQRY